MLSVTRISFRNNLNVINRNGMSQSLTFETKAVENGIKEGYIFMLFSQLVGSSNATDEMLHKMTEALDDTVFDESSGLKNDDEDFQEQGYLWLCGACENQPTFETIYDLFHHKKTHSVGFDKTKTKTSSKPVKAEFTDLSGSGGIDDFESDDSENSRAELDNLVEDITTPPGLSSPVPSCSSEDIPLASLFSDNSQAENTSLKQSKRPKRSSKRQQVKKSNNQKVKAPNKVKRTEDELISDSTNKSEELVSSENFNDLNIVNDESEEKSNHSNSVTADENEKETDNEENSKEEAENSGTKSKVKHLCKICDTEFPSRFALSAHKKTHLFEDTGCYKCETCGKMCPKYDNFTRHLTIHYSNRQKNHQCTQCFASFYNYADLKRHTVLHLTVKPYKCEHCGEGFIRQDNLLIHEYKHTGIQYKKFACKDCDKVLNSPSALVMHAKTHSEKTVFCTEPGCKFSCYLQSQLRQHLRKHSGEKPFQCAKCGRCFARSNDMKNHILNVHEGIKPFKCSFCPKKFALIGNLKNHKVTHTNERPFLCAQCGKSFNQSSTLRKHSVIMHSPCRANGKPKKSKRMSISSLTKRDDESKRNKAKFKELPENQTKGGKNKGRKVGETEGVIEYKIDKPKPGGYIMSSTTNITTIDSIQEQCMIVHDISREVQIQVPQITVSLPIHLDHTQAFILPTVKLEPSLIKPDIKKELSL